MRLIQPPLVIDSSLPVAPSERRCCDLPVRFVKHRYRHHAAPSGYDRICDHIEAPAVRVSPALYWLGETALRPFTLWKSKRSGKWEYSRYDCTMELAVLLDFATSENRLYHFIYAEKSFHLTQRFAGKRGHLLIGTVHHPEDHHSWLFKDSSHFAAFDHLITMDRRSIPRWEEITGRRNVSWIPHGVDTAYFSPLDARSAGPMRVAFAGAHDRDLGVLEAVMAAVEARGANVQFDLVGTGSKLEKLARRFARVKHHRRLADEKYRAVLQQADLLLLPLVTSTVCNVVLEALACGTPVVTTQGGIEDYLDDSCALAVAPGDTQAMLNALLVQGGLVAGVPLSREAARRKAEIPLLADGRQDASRALFGCPGSPFAPGMLKSNASALFVSSLSPGYIAGGSQCALAFLQAVAELHSGDVDYVGPPFLGCTEKLNIEIKAARFVGPRTVGSKIWQLVASGAVDRTSPALEGELSGRDRDKTIVYVNGEAAARSVCIARSRGFSTVFIPHNYPQEYSNAEAGSGGPAARVRDALLHSWAKKAYARTSVALTLTEHDRLSFDQSIDCRCGAVTHSNMYFGYREPGWEDATVPSTGTAGFAILIGTNFELKQNERGVIEFLDYVWPAVQSRLQCRLTLAGRHPSTSLQRAALRCKGNVELVSRPSHEDMERIFARSSLTVATTREGSGIKLRVAELLRRGLPVVATRHCARGYEMISPRVLKVYDAPAEAIDHILAISSDDADRIREQAWSEYNRVYSFRIGVEKMRRCCGALIA